MFFLFLLTFTFINFFFLHTYNIHPYYSMRAGSSIRTRWDCVFGQKCVIPESMRKEMKQKLHSAHTGIQSTIRRARDSIYWPGMTKELNDMIKLFSLQHFQVDVSRSILLNQNRVKKHEVVLAHEIKIVKKYPYCLTLKDPNYFQNSAFEAG